MSEEVKVQPDGHDMLESDVGKILPKRRGRPKGSKSKPKEAPKANKKPKDPDKPKEEYIPDCAVLSLCVNATSARGWRSYTTHQRDSTSSSCP